MIDVSEDPFMLIYCPNRCKTQKKKKKKSDEAVNDCLVALKFIPDWIVTSKTLEKFHDALLANDDYSFSLLALLFFDEDFSKVTLFANRMGILSVDLDKINLDDDNNFYEDNPETIIHVKLLAWHNKFEKYEAFKKHINKELMPVTWHPSRWWDWCMLEDEKKQIEPIFANNSGW